VSALNGHANGNGASVRTDVHGALQVALGLPGEVVEMIAERAAEIVAERQGASALPVWLGTAGAAEYMACTTGRVHDLVQARVLRPRRDGRRLVFKRAELDDYLEGSS
jgi:excisionase family DNA binding protein